MGACETTPPTRSHDPGEGHQGDPSGRQPNQEEPRSSLPIIGRRLAASSSFVLACALQAQRLRALQLDPRPARRHKPAATRKRGNSSPQPGGRRNKSPGQFSTAA